MKCTRLVQLLSRHHWMTPDERMELFWAFLEIGKFDKALKCIASDFQFNAVNPWGATLLVRAIGKGLSSPAEQKQCLELIKALRVGGARWTQPCKRNSGSMTIWETSDREKTEIKLEYGTHSALSWVQAWLHQLKDKEEWQQDVSFLHKVLESFLAEAPPSRNKLAIDEGIVTKLKRSQVLSFFFLARFPNERG